MDDGTGRQVDTPSKGAVKRAEHVIERFWEMAGEWRHRDAFDPEWRVSKDVMASALVYARQYVPETMYVPGQTRILGWSATVDGNLPPGSVLLEPPQRPDR